MRRVLGCIASCVLVLVGAPTIASATPPDPAAATCGYDGGVPADDASREQVAGWMASGAIAAGLPPELPVMGALVESGLRNLHSGDADAVGYFAMRESIWNHGAYAGFPDNVALQLQWFVDQATLARQQGMPTDPNQYGEWIADVERPAEALRGRYQLRLDEARTLIAAGCAGSAPVVTISAPPAGPGGWFTAPVTITVSATDTSGVATLTCTDGSAPIGIAPTGGSFTISADGTHVIACEAADPTGNTGSAATTVKLDRTPPKLAFTGNLGRYDVAATVNIVCNASDELSGLDPAATTCTPIQGPASSFAAGPNSFAATAADIAGNTVNASTTFTVSVSAGGIGAVTLRYLQGSARYQSLPPAQRAVITRVGTALRDVLATWAPRLPAVQRSAIVRAYQRGVAALVGPGWLTAGQSAELQRLASALL